MTRPLALWLLPLAAGAVQQPGREPRVEDSLRVAPLTHADSLLEEQVHDQSAANLTLDAAAAVLEIAADEEGQPEAGALPMACSDSLVKTAEISTSSCKETNGVCTAGPLQSVMDGTYDHAWQPKQSTKDEFIMYKWTKPQIVHYIQTSGMSPATTKGGIGKYKVEYGTPEGEWEFWVSIAEPDKAWTILDGAAEAPDAKMNALNPPIETTFLRIRPTEWPMGSGIAMRASIRGCGADTVKAGDLTLNADFKNIFPSKFRNKEELATELRLQVSQAVQASVDSVAVTSIKASPTDKTRTIARVELLPKSGQSPPATMLNKLAQKLGDTNSDLYKWAQKISKRQNLDQYSCEDVDCHAPNGQCAGGQCFCVAGWEGSHCETQTEASKQFDGVKEGDTAVVDTVGDLKPLPVLAGLTVTVTDLNANKPAAKLSPEEMQEQIDEVALGKREENLDDEDGFSGLAKQHFIVLVIIGSLMVILWATGIYMTYSVDPKLKALLEEEEEEEEEEEDDDLPRVGT